MRRDVWFENHLVYNMVGSVLRVLILQISDPWDGKKVGFLIVLGEKSSFPTIWGGKGLDICTMLEEKS